MYVGVGISHVFSIFRLPENPCPEMGQVLTFRLSESHDHQWDPKSGIMRPTLVETFFQMNYDTMEWKKLLETSIVQG